MRMVAMLLVALTATACADQPVGPKGSLSSKDLGSGWLFIATTSHPKLDMECESLTFDRDREGHVVPARVVATNYSRPDAKPGDITDVTEYVMRFHSADEARKPCTRTPTWRRSAQ
jgi:hypothetical protein